MIALPFYNIQVRILETKEDGSYNPEKGSMYKALRQ